MGIGLREHARGQGYGREALALLTGWLFEHAAAHVIEGDTDPANAAMPAVFHRAGRAGLDRGPSSAANGPSTGSPGRTGWLREVRGGLLAEQQDDRAQPDEPAHRVGRDRPG